MDTARPTLIAWEGAQTAGRRLAAWPATPAEGFSTILALEEWPPRHWVVQTKRRNGFPNLTSRDFAQVSDALCRESVSRDREEARDSEGSALPATPWRWVLRLSYHRALKVDDVAARCTEQCPPDQNPTVWIDAPRVEDHLPAEVEALETRVRELRSTRYPDGGATAIVILRTGWADGGCVLERFVRRSSRGLVPVVKAADGEKSRSVVSALTEQGAVVPVEIRVGGEGVAEAEECCRRWAEINRGAGLLITPGNVLLTPESADRLASLLLRLYEADFIPSSRLFPLNVVLAQIAGGLIPPLFAGDPIGRFVDGPPLSAKPGPASPVTANDLMAELVQGWRRHGVRLPDSGTPEFKWIERLAAPLYARLVAQVGAKLVGSAGPSSSDPPVEVGRRALLRDGRLVIERGPVGNGRGPTPADGEPADGPDRGGWRTKLAGARYTRVRSSRPFRMAGRAHPGSLPRHCAVTAVDLDVTKACNLRCVYCFKSDTVHPGGRFMSLETAKAAVDWLIDASMGADQLWVHLMGGEPLLAWDMITKLVPYAKLRAGTFGAGIQFGTTTNLTLVTPEVIEFSRRWGMGWHCSIDGVPQVQNGQRPPAIGDGSSAAAERGARLVLGYRPTACARATVTPRFVDRIFDSLLHFESLGFVNFGFATAQEEAWSEEHFAEFDRQWAKVADHVIRRYREGKRLMVGGIDWFIEKLISGQRREYPCGAGRGSVLIDHRGDLWPCHRWDGADWDSSSHGQWRLGNIFRPPFDDELHLALLSRERTVSAGPDCAECPVEPMCAGGCPAANLALTRSIYRVHPTECRIQRILVAAAGQVHGLLQAEDNRVFQEAFYAAKTRRT